MSRCCTKEATLRLESKASAVVNTHTDIYNCMKGANRGEETYIYIRSDDILSKVYKTKWRHFVSVQCFSRPRLNLRPSARGSLSRQMLVLYHLRLCFDRIDAVYDFESLTASYGTENRYRWSTGFFSDYTHLSVVYICIWFLSTFSPWLHFSSSLFTYSAHVDSRRSNLHLYVLADGQI